MRRLSSLEPEWAYDDKFEVYAEILEFRWSVSLLLSVEFMSVGWLIVDGIGLGLLSGILITGIICSKSLLNYGYYMPYEEKSEDELLLSIKGSKDPLAFVLLDLCFLICFFLSWRSCLLFCRTFYYSDFFFSKYYDGSLTTFRP